MGSCNVQEDSWSVEVLDHRTEKPWNLPFYFLFLPLRVHHILSSFFRQTPNVVLVTNDRLRGLGAVTAHVSWAQPHSKGMTLSLWVTV